MTPHDLSVLETEIEAAWEARDTLSPKTTGQLRAAVELAIELLDSGRARVAEKAGGDWIVHQWLKKAVLLSFRLNANGVMHGAPSLGGGVGPWWDKVGNKFDGWDADRFEAAGFRAVPGAVVRKGAYVGKNVVLMPSFVNIGGYVDRARWSTPGLRSAPAPRLARACTFRVAWASAGCWNRCRPIQP